MKRRFTAVVCLVLFLGLAAFGAHMWFRDYPVYFEKDDLHVFCTITGLERPEGPRLSVGFNNRGRASVLVLEDANLGEPFEVVLASAATGKEVARKGPAGAAGAGRMVNVRAGQEHSWNVPLGKLYGKLPPGEYAIQVIYDTKAAAERGDEWAKELDLGRTESPPLSFKVPAPK